MLPPALEITNLHVHTDQRQILHNIALTAKQNEFITLLGTSAHDRSSLLQAIAGIHTERRGSIRIHGTESSHLSTAQVAELGIAYKSSIRSAPLPLSCEDNLLLPLAEIPSSFGGGMSLAELYELFPDLSQKKSLAVAQLSAGEQQMLAIARILRTGATLLLLDDLSAGLAPVSATSLARSLDSLKKLGYTILMAEQNLHFAAHLSDSFYLLESGTIQGNNYATAYY